MLSLFASVLSVEKCGKTVVEMKDRNHTKVVMTVTDLGGHANCTPVVFLGYPWTIVSTHRQIGRCFTKLSEPGDI